MNITVDNSFIEVLDHGYVRLVDSMGSDLSIVRSARVSYSADWRSGDDEKSDEKLLRFLWRNKHTSPFEAVEFQFEIKCPIFVARQWHRHRTQSYNEVSARYTELPEEYYVPDTIVIGKQDEKNKQSRMISASVSNEYGDSIYIVNEHHKNCFELYKDLLKNGWPRELARSVLPMATYTRFFAKSNLRNWLHFLELRLDPHAQYEIRVYAEAIKTLIHPIIPVTWEIMYG